MMGLTLIVALGGVSEKRAVTQWMNGRQHQRPHALRFAQQLATDHL